MRIGKPIWIVAGIVAGGFALSKLFNLKRLNAELEIVTSMAIHKVTFSGLALRIDVVMKNPTGGSLKVKHPFVKMKYQGNAFATSQVKDQDFKIPKFGQLKIDPIYVEIPFAALAGKVPGLLKQYRESGKVTLEAETITTLNDVIPYSKTDLITT